MRPDSIAGRLLLQLYPPAFRRAYGDEILHSLDDDLRDADSLRGAARTRARARAIADVIAAAAVERAAALRKRAPAGRRQAGPRMSSHGARDDGRRRTFPAEWMAGLPGDVRYAARTLWKSPGFTAVSVLTLGIAIGATTTIFSVVNGVLLKPLPYAAPDRLVNIWNDLGRGAQSLPAVHPADFRDYQAWSRLFEGFAAASGGNVVQATGILTGDGGAAEQVSVSSVTANFFPLLGVAPIAGRHFTADEERPGGPRVALLAHDLWRQRYGGDLGLVGRSIQIDGRSYTVVGILPPAFRLYLPAEAFLVKDAGIWLPLNIDYARLPPRNFTYLTVFGRMKTGVTLQQAQGEMDAIAERLRREHPVHRASDLRIRVVPLHFDVVKRVQPALLLLLGAVGVVLLIGCVNVANLLFARAGGRRREMAVHAALGASRWRIVRRLLIESVLLAASGAVLGLCLTQAALWALAALTPADLPRMDGIGIDRTVLVVASLICLGTAVLCGALPARHASKRDTVTDLKEASWGADGAGQDRVRRRLVVGEVALSFVLIAGAGLLVRSAILLHQASPGFDAGGVLTFRLALPAASYPRQVDRRAFLDRLQLRLRRLPGVETVGATSQLPLTGSGTLSPYAYDEETARNWESVTADGRSASPEFFPAIGARLIAGRLFTEGDDTEGRPVIIVDDELARRVWPEGNAVGQRLQVAPPGSDETHAEVVGVVRHLRLYDLARAVRPQIWRPLLGGIGSSLSVAVRTPIDPSRLAGDVRRAIAEIDPDLAVSALEPLSALVTRAGAQDRLNALLMLAFGALALTLAAVGVYSVMAYTVARRTREFGIRQALGQEPAALRRMVLGQAARLGATAVVFGLVGSRLAAPPLERLLYETDPADPVTLAGTSALLLVVVLAAAWAPAHRATRIDPMAAIRSDSA